METEVKGCVCRAASVGAFPTVFPDESWKTYDASEAVHPLRGDAQEAWLDMRVARLIARSHASVLTNLVLYVMVSSVVVDEDAMVTGALVVTTTVCGRGHGGDIWLVG